jgi:hypothetical protein
MTDNEGLSVREAVDWCSGGLTVREITRLLRLDGSYQALEMNTSDERQAGPGGAPYWAVCWDDRQHGVPALGIRKVRGFPQVCGSSGLSSFLAR